MKKAISLLLAASVLCFATSAFAATATVNTSRNGTTTMPTSAASMPCFRTGDTITFTVSGVTNGNELTVISYKSDAGTLTDSNVQYINQYTLNNTSKAFEYKIREQTSGTYVLKINDSTGTAATFYYKVANLTATIYNGSSWVSSGIGTPYMAKYSEVRGKWSVGFIGKITKDNNSVTLTEAGVHPGFEIVKGGYDKKYGFDTGVNSGKAVSALENGSFQADGGLSYIYGVTMFDVPNKDGFTVTAIIDAAE